MRDEGRLALRLLRRKRAIDGYRSFVSPLWRAEDQDPLRMCDVASLDLPRPVGIRIRRVGGDSGEVAEI
jgi:hypothetical protein